jgi:hypothetical protein
VNIRYTKPGKGPGEQSPPKTTTRPIHKIEVIVPVDNVFEDDFGSRARKAGLPELTQAEASNHEEGAPTPPDLADQGAEQPKPAEETRKKQRQGSCQGRRGKKPQMSQTLSRQPGRVQGDQGKK